MRDSCLSHTSILKSTFQQQQNLQEVMHLSPCIGPVPRMLGTVNSQCAVLGHVQQLHCARRHVPLKALKWRHHLSLPPHAATVVPWFNFLFSFFALWDLEATVMHLLSPWVSHEQNSAKFCSRLPLQTLWPCSPPDAWTWPAHLQKLMGLIERNLETTLLVYWCHFYDNALTK